MQLYTGANLAGFGPERTFSIHRLVGWVKTHAPAPHEKGRRTHAQAPYQMCRRRQVGGTSQADYIKESGSAGSRRFLRTSSNFDFHRRLASGKHRMVKIVGLQAEDASRLLPLLSQVQAMHVPAHPDIFHDDASETEREGFLRGFISRDDVTALVAITEEGYVIGYLIYEIQARDASSLKSAFQVGFLHHIAVDETRRGQGVGSELIMEMKTRLRATGISKLRSEHFAFNTQSAALLQSAGLSPLRITVEGDL